MTKQLFYAAIARDALCGKDAEENFAVWCLYKMQQGQRWFSAICVVLSTTMTISFFAKPRIYNVSSSPKGGEIIYALIVQETI